MHASKASRKGITVGRNQVRYAVASATASDQASPENEKARVLNSALLFIGLGYSEPQAESQHQFDYTEETYGVLTNEL